jgi:CHAT domain-containing protein
LATQNNDVERVLESLALLAQIQAAKGNRGRAIEISDELIQRIAKVINGMKNQNRLVSVHQKMYEYLKQAVTLEIDNQDVALSFLKLDYVKALWRTRGSSAVPLQFDNAAALEVLREQLVGSHKLVIHYFLANDELYAFLMDGTGLTLLRKSIGFDELRSRVDAYKKAIEDTAPLLRDLQPGVVESHYSKTCQLGSQLYEDLMGWPELRSKLEKTEILYVIPDEFLYEVPFATLATRNTGREWRFLAEKVCVVNVSSAVAHGTEEQRPESHIAKRTLVSADPDFPSAEDLLAAIKARLTAVEELQTQGDATDKGEILKRLNRGYQVYVLFGHGMANALYPEFSSIELSARNPAGGSPKKVTLFAEDLQKVNWSGAELVLLMGCDTAGGRLYRGSGISGLQQRFLTAGAHAVVASQWKIDAVVAVTQMKFFLDAWVRTSDPTRAFHEFQKASIASLSQHSSYRNPHPYLWGSYTLAIRN